MIEQKLLRDTLSRYRKTLVDLQCEHDRLYQVAEEFDPVPASITRVLKDLSQFIVHTKHLVEGIEFDIKGLGFPRIEPDTTEGINKRGFILRLDEDLNWHWLTRKSATRLYRELGDKLT